MIEAPPPFDLAAASLEDGWTLIEASAGTGKTYNIAGLYVRLILDRRLEARQIWVMTYTDAATHELRLRLRERLSGTLRAMESGKSAAELAQAGEMEFVCAMVAAHNAGREMAAMRLRLALGEFDSAPVQTIHSACRSILKQHALACGEAPDLEIAPDISEILRQVACDFWRREAVGSDSLQVCALMVGVRQFGVNVDMGKSGAEALVKLYRECRSDPEIEILGPVLASSVASAQLALQTAFDRLAAAWKQEEATVRGLLSDDGISLPIRRDKYGPAMDGMVRMCAGEFSIASVLGLGELIPEKVGDVKRMKKNRLPPEHPFFGICGEFWAAAKALAGDFLARFLRDASGQLEGRMRELRLCSYDDLITRLDAALRAPGGAALASRLREQMPAALVDEFQDTDPVQCRILEAIYRDGGTLFLIGDPKQSIYRFRGADIFSYLAMADKVKARYTLNVNYRSEPPLIQAVNTIFSRATDPFLDERIRFNEVKPMDWSAKSRLADGGRPPMRIWLCPGEEGDRVPLGLMDVRLPTAVAGEIVRLLDSDTRIGRRRLRPTDFAVLVKKNKQAELVQQALLRRKVPAVLRARESVFASREAQELGLLLAALARPDDHRHLHAALTTELLGWTAGQILHLTETERRGWAEAIENGNATFRRWGFLAMFREWIRERNVVERLVSKDDGERRLTNLFHLSRLLHEAAMERGGGLADLGLWLASQTADPKDGMREHELQLESDADAVRIVTVHCSKGLEYPIVFLPYLWDRRDTDEIGFKFHPDAETRETARQAVEFGSPNLEAHRSLAMRENLAEDVRNVYVAVTRAKHICYFVHGRFGEKGRDETPGIAHLLHPMLGSAPVTIEKQAWSKSIDATQLEADTKAFAKATHGCVEVADSVPEAGNALWRPESSEEMAVVPRVFTGTVRDNWRIKSFSSLAKGVPRLPEETPSDRDEEDFGVSEGANIHAFERGVRAGTCYHAIMEDWWKSTTANSRRQLVARQLQRSGFDAAQWQDVLFQNVNDVVGTPLAFVGDGFRLNQLRPEQASTEMRFTFSQQKLCAVSLGKILQKFGCGTDMAETVKSPDFKCGAGVVTGSMDLVFEHDGRYFVLDWKTNWLGPNERGYDSLRVQNEMKKGKYHLQHVLYSLALHRHLSRTLDGYSASANFGGVVYLFVRGMSPVSPERGVYTTRPQQDLLEALSVEVGSCPVESDHE